MFILGLNAAYHESAACLMEDGVIVQAVEEERFSRIRHAKVARPDNAGELPWQAIHHCLAAAGIALSDVAHIGFSLDPAERLRLNLAHGTEPGTRDADFGTPEGERVFHDACLSARAALHAAAPNAEFHFLPHHLCHAASAFLVSPFERAAVLAVDGIGEYHSTWLGTGDGTTLTTLGEIPYPNSLGLLWETISVLLGLDVYSGPGKVMGLSGLTDDRGEASLISYHDRFRELVSLLPDGTFRLDPARVSFRGGDLRGLEALFGPRRPRFVDRYEDASVAAGLQRITEDVLVHLANHLYARVNRGRPWNDPIDRLCLAGGVALNCVANEQILRRTRFRELWVQPAANDAGTALGAAALLSVAYTNGPRPRMAHTFLGPDYGADAQREALAASGLLVATPPDVLREAAAILEAGGVIAWFDGALEFGPRALGHRSILADPTRFDTRNRLNLKVKHRESFRPFAPSLLPEELPVYFDAALGPAAGPEEFMLRAVPVRGTVEAQLLPAVVQHNLSTNTANARVHVVRPATNPRYHALLSAWREVSGVGVLLNTSFNISEPIVATPADAVRTFGRSGMDALVMGPFLARRP